MVTTVTVPDKAPGAPLDAQRLMATVQRRAPIYDKDREGHYNLISALHKSLRERAAPSAPRRSPRRRSLLQRWHGRARGITTSTQRTFC